MILETYLQTWKLSEPSLITKTATGHVYRVRLHEGSFAALKLLTPLGVEDEAGGTIALRHFAVRGSVKLLEADAQAQLMSYADGPFLKSLPDDQATEVICKVVSLLHACPSALPPGLPSMAENFRALFEQSADPLFTQGARIARELLANERERVVLHGDLHHKNVLSCSTGGWLAIDPKGLIGERAYDFANVFYNPDDAPALVENRERVLRLAATFSRHAGIEERRILEYAFAFGCLSASWAIEDGQDPSRRLRIARMIREIL
jgi:streptomycin 6-kinase